MKKRVFCLLFVPLLVCIFSIPSLAAYLSMSVSLIESSDSSDLLLVSRYSSDGELIFSEEVSIPFLSSLDAISYPCSFYGYQFSDDDVDGIFEDVGIGSSLITLQYLNNYLFVSTDSVPVPVSVFADLYLPPVSIPASSVPFAVGSLSQVNDYYGTAFDETTPASTVIAYAGLIPYGVSPDRVVYVTPPLELLPSVTETVDSSIGWIGQFIYAIVSSPLLLSFVLLPLIALAIIIIRKIIYI